MLLSFSVSSNQWCDPGSKENQQLLAKSSIVHGDTANLVPAKGGILSWSRTLLQTSLDGEIGGTPAARWDFCKAQTSAGSSVPERSSASESGAIPSALIWLKRSHIERLAMMQQARVA